MATSNKDNNDTPLIDKEEWSLPASYYILFSQHRQRSSPKDTNETAVTVTTDEDDTPVVVWEDDTWTAADEQEAWQLIQENWDKSSLFSSHHPIDSIKEKDASAWDRFYACHQAHFFKDRHYLAKEYPHEFGERMSNTHRTWVEVGCGVGNAIWPWIPTTNDDEKEYDAHWNVVHGLDISSKAIELFCQDERFIQWNENHGPVIKIGVEQQHQPSPRSIHGHVCDISQSLPDVCCGVSDVTTLLFCLSAITEDHDHTSNDNDDNNRKKKQACLHAAATLKPGGVLILRDYGRYDAAHLKLAQSRQKRVSNTSMEYRKSDGTHCYYLTTDEIRDWMVNICQLNVLELEYVRRVYYSRKKDEQPDDKGGDGTTTTTRRRRVWVHGRFQKPFI